MPQQPPELVAAFLPILICTVLAAFVEVMAGQRGARTYARLVLIATLHDPSVIWKLLAHVRLTPRGQDRAPPAPEPGGVAS